MGPTTRPGLTRAELLVGLLIAGLAAALLLAAAGKIRSSANQMKCTNNLKQFGLAIENYQLTSDNLPPLVDQGEHALTGRGVPSGFALLIPFLEATPVMYRPGRTSDAEYHGHSTLAFTHRDKAGSLGQSSGGFVNSAWSLFYDPADSTADRLIDVPISLPSGETGYYAAGSYAMNGLLPWGRERAPPGAMLIAERPKVCRTAAGTEVFNLWGVGFYNPHMPAFAVRPPAGFAETGHSVPSADHDPPRLQRVLPGRPCDPALPGGPHRDGLLVVTADGAVRVFGWDTDPRVFWAAVAGREASLE